MSHHKTRLIVKRDPGQACVVADLEVFQHIIDLYNQFGDDAKGQEKDAWYSISGIVSEWVAKTYLPLEDEVYDDQSS